MDVILLVVALFTLANGLSEEYRSTFSAKIEEILGRCVEETDLTEELGEKCLQACIMKSMGLMQDGRFSRDGSVVMLDQMRSDDLHLFTKLSTVMDKVNDQMETIKENNECVYGEYLAQTIQRLSLEHNIHPDDFM